MVLICQVLRNYTYEIADDSAKKKRILDDLIPWIKRKLVYDSRFFISLDNILWKCAWPYAY